MTTSVMSRHRPIEVKDDNGNEKKTDQKVLDEVNRQIKSFGDGVSGVKKAQDDIQAELKAVRELAEEANSKGDNSPETKEQIEKLSTSITEKHAALEDLFKKQQEQTDKLETAFNRSPSAGTEGDRDQTKDALAFFEAKAAVTGNLAWRNRPTAETADLDGYKAWEENFGAYLRSSDDRNVEAKALSVGSNPNGGYLVPTARSARIIEKIYESSPMRQLASVETIGTEALEIPVDTDEAAVGWVGEEESRSETGTPSVGVQRIPVHELYAKPRATQQFLEDAAINVEAWLAGKVADKMSRTEATAFITGNGVKKPRGILTYDHGTAGARSTVLQYASGAASAITDDAIIGMPLQLKQPYLSGASWLMKRSSVLQVLLLKDGDGRPLWYPGLQAGVPSTLGSYPVYMADDMPAIGAGTLPIAFGNWNRAYTVVDRLGITTLRDPYSAKPFVEFYTRKRVGGDVVDFEAYTIMKIATSV